jgi:hypothetical protein
MRTLHAIGDRESIIGRIHALGSSDSRRWGKMTAHQAVCHLCDSYRAALGQKSVSPATGFVRRTIVKFIALHVPVRWPRGTPTRPEVEQGVGGTAPTDYEKDRAELLSVLDQFCSQSADRVILHPFFGSMSPADWLRWGYLHADHHLRQFGR